VTGVTLLLRPGWTTADDLAALAIAVILGFESLPLFRDGMDVLTERTPRRLSVEAVRTAARAVPGVADIHDIHIWSVCSSLVCMTAYVEVDEIPLRQAMEVTRSLRNRMEEDFGILHATFELEPTVRT
jgi:cobalt-zinc-cadmium efflux system protein